MNAELITNEQQTNGIYHHMTVAEAAKRLGVSESTIRAKAKKLGVRKISGRTIAGFIAIDRSPVPVCIAYSE